MNRFEREHPSESAIARLLANFQASIDGKRSLLFNHLELAKFEAAVQLIVRSYRQGGRLYIAGNGGSASDAQHIAGELVCKLSTPRDPLPAEALAADCATLTAIANDFGYEELFARQLRCKATGTDVFLALTTSGNSPNILRALEECRRLGISTVLFGGPSGGKAKDLADIILLAPGANSCRVQEVHIVLYHTLVECIELALFDQSPNQKWRAASSVAELASA